MPLSAFHRQADPAAAAAWFAGDAGQALLDSETGCVDDALRQRPGQLALWLGPTAAAAPDGLDGPVPLRLHWAEGGAFHGDLHCGLPLPLASESCAIVIVQHPGDAGGAHAALLEEWPLGDARHRRLVELNTIEQVVNVCRTTIINDAWARGQELAVHGWAYGIHDGRVRDLGMTTSAPDTLAATYERCVAAVSAGRAHEADNDVVAADAARLGDVPAIVEGVIKELKHE